MISQTEQMTDDRRRRSFERMLKLPGVVRLLGPLRTATPDGRTSNRAVRAAWRHASRPGPERLVAWQCFSHGNW